MRSSTRQAQDMQLLTIRIDRIIDLAWDTDEELETTRLSFEYEGQEVRELKLPGHVQIAAGATISVLLWRENDWGSFAALRDHTTGLIYANPVIDLVSVFLWLLAVSIFCYCFITVCDPDSPNGWGTFLAGTAFAAVVGVSTSIRNDDLEFAMRARLKPPPPPQHPAQWQTFRD